MRLLPLLLVVLSLAAGGTSARAQDGNADPTFNSPTPSDPVTHHHKAYAKNTYGISCPGDRVVWVNTNSGVYHLEGERWFGRTKSGQYECERAAKAEGDHETRNGQ